MSAPPVVLMPAPGQEWKHYKGGRYVIVCLAHDTKTGNVVVIYRNQEYGGAYARALDEFLGIVDKPQYEGNYRGPRFWFTGTMHLETKS